MIGKSFVAPLFLVLILGGCADRLGNAAKLAASGGLTRHLVKTDTFTLTAWSRLTAPGQPVTVYIEGDGLAWLSRNRISPNPTPRDALALRLASLDPSSNVVYLARPCQFTDFGLDRMCQSDYWTSKRFSTEVVAAADQAINHFRAHGRTRGVHLVGYSGGAAVAALAAAKRSDVLSLRSIAGNLDHEAVNGHHKVDQLRGSLNARDVAAQLKTIPQIHYVGGRDKPVPPFVAASYRHAAGPGGCIDIVQIDAASHESGWADRWSSLAGRMPICR